MQLSREHSKETGWRWETIGELVDEPDKRVINYEFGTPEMAKNCISGTVSWRELLYYMSQAKYNNETG